MSTAIGTVAIRISSTTQKYTKNNFTLTRIYNKNAQNFMPQNAIMTIETSCIIMWFSVLR